MLLHFYQAWMNVPVIHVSMVNVKMEITATRVHVILDILDLTVIKVSG